LILTVVLARYLYKHRPSTVSQVCNITAVVMCALILLAPNPRVGYLLYPINFFVWAYLLAPRSEDLELLPTGGTEDEAAPAAIAA
jgi:hypothetical protein